LSYFLWQFNKRLKAVEETVKKLVSQQDLDAIIAGLPASVESAVSAAVTPIVTPIVTKLQNLPQADFSSEADSLSSLPATIAASVSSALAAAFAPIATPAPIAPAPDPVPPTV
jgi:hypothetical protein